MAADFDRLRDKFRAAKQAPPARSSLAFVLAPDKGA